MFVSGVYLSAIVAAGMYLGTTLVLIVDAVLLTSVCTILAGATPLNVRATCDRTYTVASGDTCDAISAAQNVSTYQLALDNPEIDANCDNLVVGETLCLGFQGADCTTVHVVVSGDGCATIADNANITLATLLANNPNVNAACSNIYPGEVLCTAATLVYGS
ncbi:hypothetical protein H0H92_008708 [Tricholoma furcatifolium]|nr:hypothetical protein H0H92_008708 [Tricholoma furcatifolium]